MKKTNYAEAASKLQGKKEEPKKRLSVKCCYMGCPLMAGAYFDGKNTCSFHTTPDYHQQVTIAIKYHMNLIKAYNKMVRWSVQDWLKNKQWLETNNFLQKADEPNSVYLAEYFYKLDEVVRNEATRLIKENP